MNKKNNINYTPMIQQYLLLKSNYPDIFLFYRLGDFYELFFDDAKKISLILNITLTKRSYSLSKEIPMAGIPFTSLNYYLLKLIRMGKSAAICEQTNYIDKTTGLIERKIIKVVTPGTVIDEFFLDEVKNRLLGSIFFEKEKFGYVTLDLCSGSFYFSEYNRLDDLLSELQRTDPEELLIPDDFFYMNFVKRRKGIRLRSRYDFDFQNAYQQLNFQFESKNLKSFGIDKYTVAISAAGCLLQYLKSIQYLSLPHVRSIKIRNDENFVFMNETTRKNLEITTSISGKKENTLLFILNHTSTPMGSRLLQKWLHSPTRNINVIKQRQEKIKSLQTIYMILSPVLKEIRDMERVLSRIALKTASPKDFLHMRIALSKFPIIKSILKNTKIQCLDDMSVYIKDFNSIKLLLDRAIKNYPSVSIKEGGVIANNYNSDLDKWRQIRDNASEYLKDFEKKERDKLGIISLKINNNRILGYFIQISKKHVKFVTKNYKKIQTLKYYVRYSIPELIDYENNIINAKEKVLEIELYLYNQLFDLIMPNLKSLKVSVSKISELDVLNNLSERALVLNYVCPIMSNSYGLSLIDSRHPVIETILTTPFISNSINLSVDSNMLLITGPNMGGKSTYMRQIALIVIMAHIGSFVPANYAHIGLFDKIFTRIGAADDLANGESTFMMEMTEMSNILNNATNKSLILVDELGRGTSMYDGLSLAWACIEYLIKKIGAMTLFSTHYFELTRLKNYYNQIKNVYFDAIEYENKISFMYSIKNGSTNKSYGLAVAKLAKLPETVLLFAKKKLKDLSKSQTYFSNS